MTKIPIDFNVDRFLKYNVMNNVPINYLTMKSDSARHTTWPSRMTAGTRKSSILSLEPPQSPGRSWRCELQCPLPISTLKHLTSHVYHTIKLNPLALFTVVPSPLTLSSSNRKSKASSMAHLQLSNSVSHQSQLCRFDLTILLRHKVNTL